MVTEAPDLPGFEIDESFPAVAIPPAAAAPGEITESTTLSLESIDESPDATVLVRGFLDETAVTTAMAAVDSNPRVKAIFADPLIEPCPTCGNSPAVGNAAGVANAVCVPKLKAAGMTGTGVLLAIVDTGVNLPYLRALGLTPNFNSSRSWVPAVAPGNPPLVPGNLPVDHGTMCAFDALIAAPEATLIDIAVLQSRRPGRTVMEGLLSDAVLAYSFLHRILTGPRRPGDFHSMVVSNSWGMFSRQWDFPVGHPGNYSDNANHPFNRIVGRLAQAGADILFAAGNCGHECPDSRCGNEIDQGIFGANSHSQVLSVAGVDLNKNRVGYSTRGPGHLTHQKPDIASFTHFKGSGVYPVDGGTSAATPVAAGVVAAVRSRFTVGPRAKPSNLSKSVTRLSQDKGTIGLD
jgi:subtilisin family serine protease